jgi:hypothetical protein
MTKQENERLFRQALNAYIQGARADGLDDGCIAYNRAQLRPKSASGGTRNWTAVMRNVLRR